MSANFPGFSNFGDHTSSHPQTAFRAEDRTDHNALQKCAGLHARNPATAPAGPSGAGQGQRWEKMIRGMLKSLAKGAVLTPTADRKPIDPPPIIQLKVSFRKDPMQNFLQSPYFFMTCSLLKGDELSGNNPLPSHLIGTVVSSLHRLKDTDNQDGGFFVFGDLSCKVEGKFRLMFTLYQVRKMEVMHITSTISDVFQVYPAKSFPGLAESTYLTRSFSDQGVRLRLRKDSRSLTTRKRNATTVEFVRKQQQDPRDLRRPDRTSNAGEGLAYGTAAAAAAAAASVISGNAFDTNTQHMHNTGGSNNSSSTGYGYDTEDALQKRRRLFGDGIMPPQAHLSSSYGHAGMMDSADMSAYGVATSRSGYGQAAVVAAAAAAHMTLPVGSTVTSSYSLPSSGALAMGYGGHSSNHHAMSASAHAQQQQQQQQNQHQLSRLDTQPFGSSGHHFPGGPFPSPSNRQSPHHHPAAFQYGGGSGGGGSEALQASPSSSSSLAYHPHQAMSVTASSAAASTTTSPVGDYRAIAVHSSHSGTNRNNSSSGCSSSSMSNGNNGHHQQHHHHNNNSSAATTATAGTSVSSTSPLDATANYTATGVSLAPFSPYAYAHVLNDAQSHLPPPSSMATARSDGLMMQHMGGSGLGLDMNYAVVGRHNHGPGP